MTDLKSLDWEALEPRIYQSGTKDFTSIYEAIKNMSKEELASFLYANADYLSAEYGQASGENNHYRMMELLDYDIEGDW